MTPRSRTIADRSAAIALAWATLVLCRVAARVVSVGTGTRTLLGLTALTAAVNAHWLITGPALGAWRRRGRDLPRPARYSLLTIGAAAAVCAEPVWYALVLTAFHGKPLPWTEAVLDRGGVNVLVVALVYAASWVSDSYADARARHRQREELESVLVDAELRALALQLQPHFLFNTLQLAAEAAYENIGTARHIVRDLETLLRRTFELEDRSLVTVTEEIDFLQSYIAIQRQRFGSRLTMDVHVDPATRNLLLPPLLLQPLVENSIQHGLSSLARPGRVTVDVTTDAALLHVSVRDDGIGFDGAARAKSVTKGLGLGVTRRRLQALFGDAHQIATISSPAGGAIVSITLPVRSSQAERPALSRRPSRDLIPGRWWTMHGTIRIVLGAAVAVATLTGAAAWLDASRSIGSPSPPGTIAMWFPMEVVAFAFAIVLWRGHGVRRWLHERDAEAQRLHDQVTTARARIGALRSGRDAMLSALGRLRFASDPSAFDRLILRTSELIRGLLSLAEDGHSSVELEADLARRYLSVIANDAPVPPTAMDISLDAAHAVMPGGSLVSILRSLMIVTNAPDELSMRARMERGWLDVTVHMKCAQTHASLGRIEAELRRVEESVRQASALDCHFSAETTVSGYQAVARFRSPATPVVHHFNLRPA